MDKKDKDNLQEQPPESEAPTGPGFDSTTMENGVPTQIETPEKELYREEHGDLTNEPT